MKENQDIIKNITEIRSMMERSSRFLSLSGWAGIMAGIYALIGAWVAYYYFHFNPDEIVYSATNLAGIFSGLAGVIYLAILILILAISTAAFLSRKKAFNRGEKAWNSTSRRLLIHMVLPLAAGGILICIFISKGLIGFIAPLSLLFYGLALFNASKFTYDDLKVLGLIQMGLGLIGSYYVEYGLLLWAIGFGLAHIGYGIYMHLKYERRN